MISLLPVDMKKHIERVLTALQGQKTVWSGNELLGIARPFHEIINSLMYIALNELLALLCNKTSVFLRSRGLLKIVPFSVQGT